MEQITRAGFSRVDETRDPDYFVRYLDATTALDFMGKLKQLTYVEMGARAGARLLDVGCGTGDDVRALGEIVGPVGSAVGLDNSEKMIAEARQRSEGSNLPVQFHAGDAAHLSFEDDYFDGCRAERVLIHVPNPEAVLAEMMRVTKPGGRLVTADADWDTIIVDAPNRELTRRVLTLVSDGTRNNWIARQVPRIFKQVGLQDITTAPGTLITHELAQLDWLVHLRETIDKAVELGLLGKEEAHEWLSGVEALDRAGLFFCAMTGFVTSGRKPE